MKKFDIVLICAALTAFILAAFFYPVEKIKFSRTTLTFSQWLNNDIQSDFLGELIAEFEASRPDVSIVLENNSYSGVKYECEYYLDVMRNFDDKKKNTQKFPDIILVDPLWFDDSEKRILFENQNGSDSRDGALKNDAYTIPLYSYFNALFYNINILEGAGFDRPPKTRSEFLDICIKLKTKNISGLSVSDDFFINIFPWIWSDVDRNTLQVLTSEKDKFDFTEKKIVESIDFFNKLNMQSMLGRPPFIKDEEEKINNFLAGKTAMITASSKLINRLETKQNYINFGITNVPYPENYYGRPIFNMNGVHAAVLSTSAHKESAFEFIDFLEAKKAELAAAAGAVSLDAASSLFGYLRPDSASGGQSGAPASTRTDEPLYAKAQSLIESAESIDDWNIFSACAALGTIAGEELNSMLKYNMGAKHTAETIKNRYAYVVR
ncbi:MAG: extracellular solute-binding protein [Treponema sp.]|nr:extracellular solute-binding protein [Treponema sp.]